MVAKFSTRREDFPPHVGELSIQHVALHVARRDGFVEEVNIEKLRFTPREKRRLLEAPPGPSMLL